MPVMLAQLKNCPILQQLQLEEALLRADKRNWCLINRGAPAALVMGISAKEEEVIDQAFVRKSPIPIIRRFSGGGTVVVDEGTIFVTWIMNEHLPRPAFVMQWTEPLYQRVLKDLRVEENDYVLGNKKCAGNAQYLCRDRFLHHTSFLWQFSHERMRYLKFPPKTPHYRGRRSHEEFLTPLQPYFPRQEDFSDKMLKELSTLFAFKEVSSEELLSIVQREHRKSTQLLSYMS